MIKRKDLTDISDEDYETRRNEFMQCQDCGEEFGGTRGDYFTMAVDEAFHCPECKSENIALVRLVHKIIVIKS